MERGIQRKYSRFPFCRHGFCSVNRRETGTRRRKQRDRCDCGRGTSSKGIWAHLWGTSDIYGTIEVSVMLVQLAMASILSNRPMTVGWGYFLSPLSLRSPAQPSLIFYDWQPYAAAEHMRCLSISIADSSSSVIAPRISAAVLCIRSNDCRSVFLSPLYSWI